MLDKILGKKESENNAPDLRKTEKETGSNVTGRIRNIVSRASDKSKDQVNKLNVKSTGGGDKDPSSKIPRPMPKPRSKDAGMARLKPPEQKKPDRPSGLDRLGGAVPGFGRSPGGGRGGGGIPDDDKRTLVGAVVFGIILIVLVGAGYYFLFYGPYLGSLQDAKNTKINEVNSYFKGALATDPQKLTLLAEIESSVTPEQAFAVDVLGPATASWRAYQINQINAQKDPYGRVMITYTSGSQKDLIMKIAAAQTLVNQADASVLANVDVTKPDTVVIPIRLDRLRAAGGLISVGDTVDIYVNTDGSTQAAPTNATNETDQTQTVSTQSEANTPMVSGATVLAILRSMTDQNEFNAQISSSQSIAINTLSSGANRTQSAGSSGIEDLLQAGSSRVWDDSTINALLSAYGVRLDQFERTANFGNLDAQYMILLEVPRDKGIFLIQNSDAIQLTISTQSAPSWMVDELHKIYG